MWAVGSHRVVRIADLMDRPFRFIHKSSVMTFIFQPGKNGVAPLEVMMCMHQEIKTASLLVKTLLSHTLQGRSPFPSPRATCLL